MSGQSRGTVSFPELSCVLNLVNEGTACDVSVRLRNLTCQGMSPPVMWVFHSKETEAQVHFLLNCHGFTSVFPNSSVISLVRVSCMPAWNIRAHQNSGGLRTWMTAGRSRSETLARTQGLVYPACSSRVQEERRPPLVEMGARPGWHRSRYMGRENFCSLGPMAWAVFYSLLCAVLAKHIQPL